MDAVSASKISLIGVVEFGQITELEIQAHVNEHALMRIKGIVDKDTATKAQQISMEGTVLSLKYESGGVTASVFSGYILRVAITIENTVCYISADCISGSYQFDQREISRSFQDTGLTYRQMLDNVAGANRNIVVIIGKKERIAYPVIQYEETDWEFVKRMASRFNTVLIPEITNSFPQISFGIVNGNSHEVGECLEYEIANDTGMCRLCGKAQSEFISYRFKTFEDYSLGDKIIFKGRTLIAVKKAVKLVKGLLEFDYTLGSEAEWGIPLFKNRKIGGLSIEGEVLETSGEKAKIHLKIDSKQDIQGAYYYDFVPISGNIMYCMPEIGAEVSLYFPNDDEKNAMVVNCIRDDRKTYENQQFKQLATPKNKILEMNRSRVSLATGKNKRKVNLATLMDGYRVSIESTRRISLTAVGNITIQAGKSCHTEASVHLRVEHTDTQNSIDFTGDDIIHSADRYISTSATKPSTTVPPKQDNVASLPSRTLVNAVFGALPVAAAGVDGAMLGAVPLMASVSQMNGLRSSIGLKVKS